MKQDDDIENRFGGYIHKLLGGDEGDSIIVMEATLEKEELPTGEFLEKMQ